MATTHKIIRNLYRDSVSMMQLSALLRELPGVEQASAIMATEGNLDLLREAGLLASRPEAGPNDLLIVLRGKSAAALDAALAAADAALNKAPAAAGGGVRAMPVTSLQMALAQTPGANLALVSTPGEYAAAEAFKALHLGLHVMLFSDNVSLAEEIALKRYAAGRELMVMGPDCGTAIVDGVPLGFANVARGAGCRPGFRGLPPANATSAACTAAEGSATRPPRCSARRSAACSRTRRSIPMRTGTPACIDVRRVVDTGILPVINTGIAHRDPGVGQIGAGVTHAPLACFTQAITALAAKIGA